MTAQQSLFRGMERAWCWKHLRGTSSARFSPCPEHGDGCECPLAAYRYELRRTWNESLRPLVAICCNPSIADSGATDDPTCRRLYSFADRWGFGGIRLFNVFALRSTDPRGLRRAVQRGVSPVGRDNDSVIRTALEEHKSDRLLIAWGVHGRFLDRGRDVSVLATEIHGRPECFALTKEGQPWHPLMVPDVAQTHLYTDLIKQRSEAKV